MIIIKKNYEHKIGDNMVDLEITLHSQVTYNLFIVYYINCIINKNYFTWIQNQINFVIPHGGNIYIVCTIEPENEATLKLNIKNAFVVENITVICNYDNEFEYPGINKVWELGQEHNKKNDIILYFQSKGITHYDNYTESIPLLRNVDSKNCENIVKNIDLIYEIFSIFSSIDKITTTSGGIGWGWYNYWVARGSYIFQVEKPLKTVRRHYYEEWLSRKLINNIEYSENDENDLSKYEITLNQCYQLYTETNTGNIGYAMSLGPGMFNNVYLSECVIPYIYSL